MRRVYLRILIRVEKDIEQRDKNWKFVRREVIITLEDLTREMKRKNS